VTANLYSFSFMPWNWSGTHPPQREILQYIEAVIEKFALRRHLRYGTQVREAIWNDATHSYTVRTGHGEEHEFDVVVSAVGMLNVPQYPQWPGMEYFEGPKFHTARWEHQHDLTGRRVAVVGTGSTTAQLVPAIAPIARQLYVFQREAGWVAPKADREYSSEERAKLQASRIRQRYERAKSYLAFERLRSASNPRSKAQQALRERCLRLIEESVDDPALRAKLTPTHSLFCKRPVISNTYYRALTRPNVKLIPHAVTRVTRTGVVDATGVEREVDAIVMATGFRAADYLATLEVKGRGGAGLHDTWNSEPSAFLGLGLPGFPNFYMLYGPGTNGGSIIFKLECQSDWIVTVVKRMQRSKVTAVEVKPSAYQRFNLWLDKNNARMAWQGGCHNYFASPSGRIVTQWPGSMTLYWLMTKMLNRVATTSLRLPARARAGNEEARTTSTSSAQDPIPELVKDESR
jgi:cation diffusion facilitator CzcD-associated flavoprotein CzcO